MDKAKLMADIEEIFRDFDADLTVRTFRVESVVRLVGACGDDRGGYCLSRFSGGPAPAYGGLAGRIALVTLLRMRL